jgi:Na+-transporting methylmalonyl-CoA/oxaloacetate decarboxylase gamma subunit
MNTLWLKIAGIAIVVLVVIIVAANFMGGERSTPPPPAPSETKTIYDQFKEDDKRLNAPVQSPNQPPVQTQAQTPPPLPATPEPAGGQAVAQAPVTAAQPERPPKFKPLEEEQQIRAEQIWQMVVTSRKMGRLPVIPYGDTVRYSRQILQEFPGTEYAYKAKRALADIPEYALKQYNVTPKELDLSEFYK